MHLRIREFAQLTGVSVRTLHYYDEIGLLSPACVDKHSGYRFYDEKSLLRMQEILFYRELDFSLKHIREILSAPGYDTQKALRQQKHLLTLKKERLERLISAIDQAMKGEPVMTAFDNHDFEQYKHEVKEKWGHTDAYREYEEKSKHTSGDPVGDMNAIFAAFAECMQQGDAPDSAAAQSLTKRLQQHITDHYYHCTNEIFADLGQMYTADERFRSNIDRHGEGTAAFVCEAIRIHCEA